MRHQNLNWQKLQVAAFDWDNTLALTRPALECSINEVLQQNGLPTWNEIKNKRDANLSFRDNFPVLFGDKAAALYAAYKAVYKQKAADLIKRPAGALETLELLAEAGVKIVLVTNKDRELLEYELPMFYNPTIFTRIVCGHEASKDKPDKAQLLFAVNGLTDSVNPENVWMIGDSAMDSACAVSAGATAVRIGQPIWNDAPQNDAKKAIFFDDFSDFYLALRGGDEQKK